VEKAESEASRSAPNTVGVEVIERGWKRQDATRRNRVATAAEGRLVASVARPEL